MKFAHFELVTFWDSLAASKGFAGDEYEAGPRYYLEYVAFLLERKPFCQARFLTRELLLQRKRSGPCGRAIAISPRQALTVSSIVSDRLRQVSSARRGSLLYRLDSVPRDLAHTGLRT